MESISSDCQLQIVTVMNCFRSFSRHFDNVLTNIERTLSDMTINITRPHATNAIVYVNISVNRLQSSISNTKWFFLTTLLDHIRSRTESRCDLQRNNDRMGYGQRVRWNVWRWLMGGIEASSLPQSSRSYTFSDAAFLQPNIAGFGREILYGASIWFHFISQRLDSNWILI